jgi:asparagine synthase (glutamine-hydrolysing)
MCGISLIISKQGLNTQVLHHFNSIIKHRGPDDEGYFLMENGKPYQLAFGNDTPHDVVQSSFLYSPKINIEHIRDQRFNIGIAHRRLSIIDTTPAGHNPMSYGNNRYWITFNGEVYNYLELREELKKVGMQFVTQTDTEVILAAYHYWGKECLNYFMGMWAFVIFDTIEQTIFAARDRFGIKPVYFYFDKDENLYLGSEIKQFTTIPGWQSKDNQEMILHYLVNSATDHTSETFFDGVLQLRGGQYLSLPVSSPKDVKVEQWYNPKNEKFKGTLQEAVEGFKTRLYDSVRLHLRSDVTIGSALSGGLDSSSVVCIINELHNKEGVSNRQQTFSSCSVYEEYDERKWMQEVVDYLKVEPHFVYPKSERVFPELSNMIWIHEIPYDSQSAFLGFNIFETAKQNGIKVLLNGQGADEYLGGYSQFFPSLLTSYFAKGRWSAAIKEMNDANSFHGHSSGFLLKTLAEYHVPSYLKTLIAKNANTNKFEMSLLNLDKFEFATSRPYDRVPVIANSFENTIDLFSFYNPLPKYLRWEDRNSMANSIEARVPFLDHRLFEFVKSLPIEFIQRNGQTKWLLREATKGVLPEKIRLRTDKKGFITPEKAWMQTESRQQFVKKMDESIEILDGRVKPIASKQFQAMLDNKIPSNQIFWRIILLAEWVKRFNVAR